MAYGLRTYSAAGVVRVDVDTRLVRYVASYSGTLSTVYVDGNDTGVYVDTTVTDLVDDGTWGIMGVAADGGSNVYISAEINNGSFRVYNRDPFTRTTDWAVTLFRS